MNFLHSICCFHSSSTFSWTHNFQLLFIPGILFVFFNHITLRHFDKIRQKCHCQVIALNSDLFTMFTQNILILTISNDWIFFKQRMCANHLRFDPQNDHTKTIFSPLNQTKWTLTCDLQNEQMRKKRFHQPFCFRLNASDWIFSFTVICGGAPKANVFFSTEFNTHEGT